MHSPQKNVLRAQGLDMQSMLMQVQNPVQDETQAPVDSTTQAPQSEQGNQVCNVCSFCFYDAINVF